MHIPYYWELKGMPLGTCPESIDKNVGNLDLQNMVLIAISVPPPQYPTLNKR